MPITYEQLYNLNLSKLSEAVTAWQETERKADQLQQDVSPDLVRPFNQAGWSSGDLTSSLAEKTVKDIEQEFTDAHKVAKAVHSVLEESRGTLQAKKKQLHDLVSEETANGEVRISPTGKITAPDQQGGAPPYAPGTSDDSDHFGPDAAQKRVDEVGRRIQKILDEAAEVDDSAAAAIRYNIGNDGKDFHNRTAGKVEKAEGRYDAAEAVKLARKGDDMTDTELSRFNALLKERRPGGNGHQDKAFAETFASRMGADGTLDFWGGMNPNDSDVSASRKKLLTETRKGLGGTLGTATRSDSQSMQDWKQDMIKAGPERQGDGRLRDPYGYQVMTDLMREGNYDDGFMKKYGDSLVDFEKAEVKAGRDPQELWVDGHDTDRSSAEGPVLIDTSNRWGNDPMAGLMDGLSHNPGASTDFFSDQKTVDYVVGGGKDARDWPEAALPNGDEKRDFNSLGNALESAVTGVPHGEAGELHRGGAEVNVMHKVMDAYSSDKDLMESQPGISDSLGRMGAAYIDDLNYGLENYEGSAEDKGSDRILGTDGNGINSGTTVGFMRELGSDKESHAIMSQAQEAFAASRIHQLDDSGDIYRAGEINAQGHGALDEARAEQIGKDYKDSDARKNQELTDAANWRKAGSSVLVYGATGAIGAATGPGASVLVPIATGAAGSGITSGINASIDESLEADKQDSTNKSVSTIDEFDQKALANANRTIRNHMESEGASEDQIVEREKANRAAYREGRVFTDTDNSQKADQ